MDRYIIGYSVDGYTDLDIEDERLLGLKDSLVVVVLREESNGKLYSYYSGVRNIIVNNNKVILVMIEAESHIRKQISMLLISYKNYNIYTIDDIGILDKDYIKSLEGREPSESEVTQYIGSDITAYSKINEILLSMIETIKDGDIESLREIIEDNREVIEGSVDVIDFMKCVVDTANSGENQRQIKALRAKLDESEIELNNANKSLKQAENEIENIKDGNEVLRKEASRAKQRVAELEEQMNLSEPVLRTYAEVQTQMIKCKTKVVIYMKEISYVRYTASLVMNLFDSFTRMRKLRAKVLIYDNKHSFLNMYKPLQVIGSSEFVADRDRVINKLDKVVVVESNQAIIEDILKADIDVLIVYDRLRQANDIVSGNNVYKYWVINSFKEYEALASQFRIDPKTVISLPGNIPEAISISEVKDYKAHTATAKLSNYVNMVSAGSNTKVFDLIEKRTNIGAIKR